MPPADRAMLLMILSGCAASRESAEVDAGASAPAPDVGVDHQSPAPCVAAEELAVALPTVVTSVAATDWGSTCATSNAGVLRCYDAEGDLVFEEMASDDAGGPLNVRHRLAVGEGTLYWSTGSEIRALNASYREQWSVGIQDASITTDNGSVFAVRPLSRDDDDSAMLLRLNAHDGSAQWLTPIDSRTLPIFARAIAANAGLVAVGGSQTVQVYHQDNGALLWEASVFREIHALDIDNRGRVGAAGSIHSDAGHPAIPRHLGIGAAAIVLVDGEAELGAGCCNADVEYAHGIRLLDDSVIWSGDFGERGSDFVLDDVELNNQGNDDVFVVRLSTSGAAISGFSLAGPGADFDMDMTVACDGDVIIGGGRSAGWDTLPTVGDELYEGFLVRTAAP